MTKLFTYKYNNRILKSYIKHNDVHWVAHGLNFVMKDEMAFLAREISHDGVNCTDYLSE